MSDYAFVSQSRIWRKSPYAGGAKHVQNQKQYSNIDDETPEEIKLSENFRGGCDPPAEETAVVSDHTGPAGLLTVLFRDV